LDESDRFDGVLVELFLDGEGRALVELAEDVAEQDDELAIGVVGGETVEDWSGTPVSTESMGRDSLMGLTFRRTGRTDPDTCSDLF
jgi:hypothetical protein